MRQELQIAINAIPADELQKTPCVKWPACMRRCIAANGRYFDKEPEITNANLNDDDKDEDNV